MLQALCRAKLDLADGGFVKLSSKGSAAGRGALMLHFLEVFWTS